MEIKDRINDLLIKQQEIMKQYEVIAEELNINETVNENINLKKKVEEYKDVVKELKEIKGKLQEENMGLKVSLKEQLMNEKIDFIHGSKKKLEIYFKRESGKNINKLNAFEETTKSKLKKLQHIVDQELHGEKEEINAEISRIKATVEEEIKKQKAMFKEENLKRGM